MWVKGKDKDGLDAWVWQDDPSDIEIDKCSVSLIKTVIKSWKDGYKDDGKDFDRTMFLMDEVFKDSKYKLNNIVGKGK